MGGDNEGPLYGYIDPSVSEIHIADERSNVSLTETLIHEACHGIAEERRLTLTEYQIDQLAVGLTGVIVDNPKIFGKQILELWK